MEIKNLTTEQRNPVATHIDSILTTDIVKTISKKDQKVAAAVGIQDDKIARVIDEAVKRYSEDRRLIYIGTGTSGRLGVLDTAELVPAYDIKPERAIGLIADGKDTIYVAVGGAENSQDLAKRDLEDLKLNKNDIVLGLVASGRIPCVIGGLDYAKVIGVLTISITCVKDSKIGHHADTTIEAVAGSETTTGSTRVKAGTVQRMILNTISTGTMIRQGKASEDVMIDVKPANPKLIDRACRVIQTITDTSTPEARSTLGKTNNDVGLAIMMLKTSSDLDQAKNLLKAENGNVTEISNR